ncbi:MAG: hypothetical protein NVSMB3_08140 [Acidobacteriaceae bacterium]
MRKQLLALVLCALTSPAALLAADNPWVGTWKLDLAKSQFTGDTFTYSKGSNGLMHFSDGAAIEYDFGTDGKPYTDPFGDTHTWTAAGDNAWDSVTKHGDTEMEKTHRTLSPDGKTLTMVSTGTRPDGTTFNNEATYTRLSGARGLEGKWRSTKVNISASDTFVVTEPSPGVYHWDIPGYKESVEGKADGSDLPITGPTVPEGMTLSIKTLSPTSLSYAVKMKGKVIGMGTQTIAPDGQSFNDVTWSPGKESEKQTGVYVKQ